MRMQWGSKNKLKNWADYERHKIETFLNLELRSSLSEFAFH